MMCYVTCEWCENEKWSLVCQCEKNIISFCDDDCFDCYIQFSVEDEEND